jgi:hypothetical protein
MLTALRMVTTPICRLAPDFGDRPSTVWLLTWSFLRVQHEQTLN